MSKIWYGNQTDAEGYVYKRFVSMNENEALQSLKIIRENSGYNKTQKNSIDDSYRKKAIKRIGNYLFLNHTQAKVLGVERNGYNTAIYIKK